MKTNVFKAITTQAEAEQFITDLITNKESFHLEDDAQDIIWNGLNVIDQPNEYECKCLNERTTEIYNVWEKDMEFNCPIGFMLDTEKTINN